MVFGSCNIFDALVGFAIQIVDTVENTVKVDVVMSKRDDSALIIMKSKHNNKPQFLDSSKSLHKTFMFLECICFVYSISP